LHVVTEDAFWRGEYVESLPKLGMHTFAFYMPDNSMTPRYNKDDLIICNIMVKLHEGKPAPVVACIRDRVYCRLLSHRASHLLFRGANRKVKPLIVSKDEVSWLYGVAMRITRENYWVKLE
jgi:SOS-response transcriptional repressor LexA